MKFVALISGGKDLFFNIAHCINNGHHLVALANLYPANKDVSEIDSFMFQTVGHDVIDSYQKCMPSTNLYRKAISGKSSNVLLEYLPTVDDEIEDLYDLLLEVKANHPDLEAVSCGAILSHYQRTRVENVCHRLGLTSLAYLWQRDQLLLMQEMCSLQLDARLIKVAAVGLSEKHLGLSLQQVFPTLLKLNSMYDVHICGEGGEFETMVFDAPFFEKKLEITHREVVSSGGDVHYLRFAVETADKQKTEPTVTSPPLILETFQSLLDSAQDSAPLSVQKSEAPALFSVNVSETSTKLFIDNVTSKKETVSQQTEDVFHKLEELLQQHQESLSSIQHVVLFVRDMSTFAEINSVYEPFFSKTFLPPSRVCVESSLPKDCHLLLSCVCMKQPKIPRLGIHIRSRSYWAPQNIGPYSQAIVEDRDSHKTATLLGQIPLIPSSMDLADVSDHLSLTVLALQHLHSVKTLVSAPNLASCVCFTTTTSPQLISLVWNEYCEQVELQPSLANNLIIVQVTALPRGATVEFGGYSFQKQESMYDDEEEEQSQSALESLDFEVQHEQDIQNHKLVTIFTNDSDKLVALAGLGHITVFTTIAEIAHLSAKVSAQWQPVLAVWNGEANSYKYGVLLEL